MNEDRALRETARSIVTAQLAHLRQGLSGKRIGESLADKVGDDAFDAFERATSTAKKNGGIVIALAGVAAAALAWKPLTAFVQSLNTSENEDSGMLPDQDSRAIEEQSDDA